MRVASHQGGHFPADNPHGCSPVPSSGEKSNKDFYFAVCGRPTTRWRHTGATREPNLGRQQAHKWPAARRQHSHAPLATRHWPIANSPRPASHRDQLVTNATSAQLQSKWTSRAVLGEGRPPRQPHAVARGRVVVRETPCQPDGLSAAVFLLALPTSRPLSLPLFTLTFYCSPIEPP